MDLAASEEQQAVQQGARRFLAAEITRDRRLAWDRTAEGHDPAFWQAVARLGWLGYGLPEAYGGQGASLLDLGLLVEELGHAVAPFGIFAAISGGLALASLGSPGQKRDWLPAVARGEKLVTLAVAEENASRTPAAFATVVRRRGRQLQLNGEKRYVLQGVTGDAFLVAARDGGGVSTVLVPSGVPGVRVQPQKTFGKDRQSIVRMKGVSLPATALAGRAGGAWPGLDRLRKRLAALLCAEMVGGADAVLEMTTRPELLALPDVAGGHLEYGVGAAHHLGTEESRQPHSR